MNETNNNQNKKTKISKLAIAAMLCIFGGPILGFGIFFVAEFALPFVSAFSDRFDFAFWVKGFLATSIAVTLAGILTTPIFGTAAIVSIVRSKGRLPVSYTHLTLPTN